MIMPSYNQARWLEEAIISVLDQGYPDLELILLDGGSADGSREIVQRYSSRLAYWRCASDSGQVAALIEGMHRATGDLLGWINSDDVLLPGALRAVQQAYSLQPDAGLFGGKFLLIDENGAVLRTKIHPPCASFFARFGLMLVNQPGSFFSRSAYRLVGGLDPKLDYVMDTDLYIRMLNGGARYVYVDRWLSGFRLHSTNKTKDLPRKRNEYRAAALGWRRAPGGNLGIALAKPAYQMYQLVNGRHIATLRTTWQLRGTHWRTVAQPPAI